MELLKISGLVFLGGGIGSVVRYSLSRLQDQVFSINFPLGTLTANLLACTILGVTIYLTKGKLDDSAWLKYFLVIGFCGGFSTFSTFGYETVQLLKTGFFLLATLNIIISLSLGLVILWVLTRS